jgi:hypothetical protein
MKRLILSLLTLSVLVPLALPADEPQQAPILESALGKEAKGILNRLKEKGYKNVGVLKFMLAREGKGKVTDSLGTLNLLLARRLEMALIVKNDPSAPIGIIEDPSAVAAKTEGASHLSEEGTAKLFGAKYPLAWGKESVQPDAFVVGLGVVSADLKTMTIGLQVIDKETRKIAPLGKEFVVRLRPEHLSETGESFTRGAFDGGATKMTSEEVEKKLVYDACKVRKGEEKHPLQMVENEKARPPFKLEVLYDNVVQPIEYREGQAWVAEPNEGQKVVVRYTRLDTTDRTYGVVVKVNGENTLFREKLPDVQSRAWLSYKENKGKWHDLRGFQVSNDKVDGFRVASRAESKAREVYYGPAVGTITLTAFQELMGKKPPVPADYDAKDEMLIRKTELPKEAENRSTFATLQQELYKGLNRGLVTEGGEPSKQEIKIVSFQRDPIPVMSVTLHYYKK